MAQNVKLELITGISKKTGNEWNALKITIGDWTKLVFPRTQFELNHIKAVLEEK